MISKVIIKLKNFFNDINNIIKNDTDLVYIKNVIPLNFKILIFIFLLPFSFIYFLILFLLIIFNLILLIFKFLKLKKNSKKFNKINIMQYKYIESEVNNSIFFWIKEFFIELSKSKSFLIFYNFLYVLNNFLKKKKNNEFKKTFLKIVTLYIIKRIIYYLTSIPFIIIKINCIIYQNFIIIVFWKNTFDSIHACIDHFFLNIYIKHIINSLKTNESFKIIFKNNSLSFNPSILHFFRNSHQYFKQLELTSNEVFYGNILTRLTPNGPKIGHYHCIADMYEERVINKKYFAWWETKSKLLNIYPGKIVQGSCENRGSVIKKITTWKYGSLMLNKSDIRSTKTNMGFLKSLYKNTLVNSWILKLDESFNKEMFELGENGLIKGTGVALKDHLIETRNLLKKKYQRLLDFKIRFDIENEDIISTLSDEQYEKLFLDSYHNYLIEVSLYDKSLDNSNNSNDIF